LKTYLKLILL